MNNGRLNNLWGVLFCLLAGETFSLGRILSQEVENRLNTADEVALFLENGYQTTEGWSAPIFCTSGYESTGWLKLTAGWRQFSASGAHAEEAENCRANSVGV
jgi:hypothetical protein